MHNPLPDAGDAAAAAAAGPFSFEALLHTYLAVGAGNAGGVAIRGLQGARGGARGRGASERSKSPSPPPSPSPNAGVTYLDKPSGGAAVVEEGEAVSLGAEVDRIYANTP